MKLQATKKSPKQDIKKRGISKEHLREEKGHSERIVETQGSVEPKKNKKEEEF